MENQIKLFFPCFRQKSFKYYLDNQMIKHDNDFLLISNKNIKNST